MRAASIVPRGVSTLSLPHTAGPMGESASKPRHHWIVRVTHWVNVVALTIMIASGLRIFNAYPAFARKGESFCCWPWEGTPAPAWLTFGGWLAGARNWHFAMMWVLAANGLVYLSFLYLHGEWRDLVPRRGDPRDAWEMVKFYLFVRSDHPRQGKHNALQKTVYFSLPILGALAVLTGLAIWKPVSLGWLTSLFGGYAWARYWHFMTMLALVALSFGHVFMVFAVDPQSLRAMTTGGYDESRSPEALDARPFYRRRSPVMKIRRGAPSPDAPGDARDGPATAVDSFAGDGDRPMKPDRLGDGDRSTAPVEPGDADRATGDADREAGTARVDGDADEREAGR